MSGSSDNLTTRQTLLLATIVGVVVANIYYIQPLLPVLARSFDTTAAGIGTTAMLIQMGTAAGMLIFVPLGDTCKRRSLAIWLLLAAAGSLALFASAQSLLLLAGAGLLIGLTASAVHVLVPFAAHLAAKERRGSAVGMVLGGLLLGILLARTVSGYVSQRFGWRSVYWLACVLMLIAALCLRLELPSQDPEVKLGWVNLLKSAWTLVQEQPVVREATLVSACLFFAFSAFWTTLAFFLQSGHYSYGSAVAGNFGLVGAAGALAAPLLGKLADRHDTRRNVLITITVMMFSFVTMAFWGAHLIGLVVGVLLLDLGMQGTHVSNQTRIYAALPEAKSRLNMVYMFAYFTAGAWGSLAGTKVWQLFGWIGVCLLGIFATATSAIVFFLYSAPIRRHAIRTI